MTRSMDTYALYTFTSYERLKWDLYLRDWRCDHDDDEDMTAEGWQVDRIHGAAPGLRSAQCRHGEVHRPVERGHLTRAGLTEWVERLRPRGSAPTQERLRSVMT